jgi:hypothetical protein
MTSRRSPASGRGASLDALEAIMSRVAVPASAVVAGVAFGDGERFCRGGWDKSRFDC